MSRYRDRLFFVYLRGYIPESKKTELALADGGLADATFEIGASVVYKDGGHDDKKILYVSVEDDVVQQQRPHRHSRCSRKQGTRANIRPAPTPLKKRQTRNMAT